MPLNDARVLSQVRAPSGKTVPVQLAWDIKKTARIRRHSKPEEEGIYEISSEAFHGDKSLGTAKASFQVADSMEEFHNASMNSDLLKGCRPKLEDATIRRRICVLSRKIYPISIKEPPESRRKTCGICRFSSCSCRCDLYGMDSAKTQGVGMRSSRQSLVSSRQSAVDSESDSMPDTGKLPPHRLSNNDCRLPTAVSLLLALFLCVTAAVGAQQDGRWAILLTGASGDSELQQVYLKEIMDLHAALIGPLGFSKDHITVLFDDPSKRPDLIQRQSTLENLQTVCRDLAGRVKREDLVFVFIDGHGSYDGKAYKLNLVGPDPTAETLAPLLYSIPAQRFVILNATSCSGGGIPALSQEGRVVITATKSGMEKNQTHMGRYFIDAFKDNAADSDKNGRVSIMEAFSYTKKKVEDYYSSEGNLQTEHPVLDDNGDAKAIDKPSPENGDGLLAANTFLDAGVPSGIRKDLTAEQQELERAARELEKQIEALKYSKDKMTEDEYENKLEDLLLRLARINAKLSQ